MDVMFSRSTDGGRDVEPAGARQRRSGDVRVAVVRHDVRRPERTDRRRVARHAQRRTAGGYLSELYYSYSTDAGVTWSPNVALTPAFDPHVGWPQQNKMGDYFHMVSDEFGANLAYAATFNGEQDVYFARIGDPACPDDGPCEAGQREATPATETVEVAR